MMEHLGKIPRKVSSLFSLQLLSEILIFSTLTRLMSQNKLFLTKIYQNDTCLKNKPKLVPHFHVTKTVVGDYGFRFKVKTVVGDYGFGDMAKRRH